MFSPTRLVIATLLTFALAACGAPAPSPSPVDPAVAFQGTTSSAVAALIAAGFSCIPDRASPQSGSGVTPSPVHSRNCQKNAPADPAVTPGGTFVTLYALANNGSIVGITILTWEAGAAGTSSSVVETILPLVSPPTALAAIQKMLTDPKTPTNGTPFQMTTPALGQVLVQSTSEGRLAIELWGPALLASFDPTGEPITGPPGGATEQP